MCDREAEKRNILFSCKDIRTDKKRFRELSRNPEVEVTPAFSHFPRKALTLARENFKVDMLDSSICYRKRAVRNGSQDPNQKRGVTYETTDAGQ